MFCRCFGFWAVVDRGCSVGHAFEDALGDFFQVLADQAGSGSVDVLALGGGGQKCSAGIILETNDCFQVPAGPGRAMFCRCVGFWAVLGRGCSAGML